MGKRYTIGVLIGNAHTSHPRGLVKGICDRVKGKNIKVVFFLGTQTNIFYREMFREDYDYQYNTIYEYATLGQMDALIIAYGSLCIFREDSDLNQFLAPFKDIPYVLLEDIAPDERGVHIIADNYGGMRKCVEHLIEHHHYQKICYLSGPKGNRDAMERLDAYRDVMREHQLSCTEEMIRFGNFSENVDARVEELLDANPDTEAIVSANDEMTIAIYKVLRKRGLVVGKDIAVTGFDNTDMSRFTIPRLTTVTQDCYQMGVRALDLALAICKGEPAKSERLPGVFIPRESCGCTMVEGAQYEGASIERGSEPDLRTSVMDLQEFQRQAWMFPYIMRDLILETEDEKRFFVRAAEIFHSVGAKNLYIYTLKKPLVYHKGEQWQCPDKLFLTVQCLDGDITYYEKKKRPVAMHKEKSESKTSEKDAQAHVYMNFLLYESVRQYGMLSVEIEPEAISYIFVLALLFGTALHFFELEQKQQSARHKLKQQNEILGFVAAYDELTGVYNRRGLFENLMRFNGRHRGKPAYLLIGDLDHLKQINDTFGHVEGDYAIRTAAGILGEALGKKADIGRFGGDEFVAVFLDNGENDKERYMKAIKERCEEYNRTAGKPYYVDISLGVAEFICGADVDIKEMLRNADKFLYEAKKNRRQNVKKEEETV